MFTLHALNYSHCQPLKDVTTEFLVFFFQSSNRLDGALRDECRRADFTAKKENFFISVVPISILRLGYLHRLFSLHFFSLHFFYGAAIALLLSQQSSKISSLCSRWATAMTITRYWMTKALPCGRQNYHGVRDLTGQLLIPLCFHHWFHRIPPTSLCTATAGPT